RVHSQVINLPMNVRRRSRRVTGEKDNTTRDSRIPPTMQRRTRVSGSMTGNTPELRLRLRAVSDQLLFSIDASCRPGENMRRRNLIHLLPLFAVVVLMLGCGSTGDNPSAKTGPTPTPGASGPTPGPTATPTPGAPTPTPTPAGGEVRLRARGEAFINGAEVELRGNFERRPDRTRLDGELEDINLPLGSAVSFCLVQGGRTIPLAVGMIQSQDGRRAEFHIRTDDGQHPPNVQAGDVLQARDGANGNMADCSRPLLVAGTFVPDESEVDS